MVNLPPKRKPPADDEPMLSGNPESTSLDEAAEAGLAEGVHPEEGLGEPLPQEDHMEPPELPETTPEQDAAAEAGLAEGMQPAEPRRTASTPDWMKPEAYDTEAARYIPREELDARHSPAMKEFGDNLIKRGLGISSTPTGYQNNRALPSDVRALPMRQQTVFRIAYNNALAAGRQPEQARAAAEEAVDILVQAEPQ